MAKPSRNLEIALEAREKGIVAIPCAAGTKIPAVSWKRWQVEIPPVELQREWFDQPCNIAIITTDMVVFDVDDSDKVDLVLGHCGQTPHRVLTPSGGTHLGYRKRKGVTLRNQVKIRGMAIDIRTDGGIELIPNSETDSGSYRWLGQGLTSISELPVATVGWTRERPRKSPTPSATAGTPDEERVLYRGRKYVDTFPDAIAGSNGHRTTFIAALKIARFCGGNRQIAWQLLLYYNATKCRPACREEPELKHKLDDSLQKWR